MNNQIQKGKILSGKVVSKKMTDIVVVEIESSKRHPLYNKMYKVHKKIQAYCTDENIEVGSVVNIQSCRPISKNTHFKVQS